MVQINVFRGSKCLCVKMIVAALSLVVNFTQAAEIKDSISEERLPELEMQMYHFPNQEEYLVLCTMKQCKEGEDSLKIYKGSLGCLTQLFNAGYNHCSVHLKQKCNHIIFDTTIGSFTNDSFYDEKAPDSPAWYDTLKSHYFPLTPYNPKDDDWVNIVFKDIDIVALESLSAVDLRKEIQLIGLNEEETAKKRLLIDASISHLDSDSEGSEGKLCVIS